MLIPTTSVRTESLYGGSSMSAIPASLQHAYCATEYRVLPPHAFLLRIGARSDALLDLYRSSGAREAAFLTAWNPFSITALDEQNRGAQARLVECLASAGATALPGFGIDPASSHPGEESILALGLPRDTAIRIAQEFQQNALVWIGPDAIPNLILLQ